MALAAESGITRLAANLLFIGFCGFGAQAGAATAAHIIAARVTQAVDANDTVVLPGNTHPFARLAVDKGIVDPATPLRSLRIVLQRSPEQERALADFNARQLDPASPDYHHWLQPREFGLAYGPSDADIAAVTGWLTAAGLRVDRVADGRVAIEFSGTAAAVQQAFGIELHRYLINGTTSVANDRDPQVPRAVRPVVAGVVGLSAFPVHALAQRSDTPPMASRAPASGSGTAPQLTVNDGPYNFVYVSPYDFATIYNSLPLWNSAKPIVGSGVTIAIVGDNDINPNDIATFRSTFGLPASTPTVKFVGTDPKGSSAASTSMVEIAGAAAPGAAIELVVPENGTTVSGLLSAVSYIMDHNLAPIVEFGYFECEKLLGTSNNAMINAYWQQGATQGMSIFVAAGDQGSASCSTGEPKARDSVGLQVSGFASSPFVTAVGGTDFAWQWGSQTLGTYFNTTHTAQYESAKGYVPEVPWNTTCTNALLLENQGYLYFDSFYPAYPYSDTQDLCNANVSSNQGYSFLESHGGGGGYSHCTTLDASGNCATGAGYTKPYWQTGTGVPADGMRDVPDVSLFASSGWPVEQGLPGEPFSPLTPLVPSSMVLICYSTSSHPCSYGSYADIAYQTSGGTSLTAAYWSGILALVEQKQGGARQGLVNPTLYGLWYRENLAGCGASVVTAGNSCVFYDVTAPVTNGMVCVPHSSSDCYVIPGSKVDTEITYGILDGYTAGVGYDQATGLGSVNIANLVNSWPSSSDYGPDSYASASRQLTIPWLQIGNAVYSDVVITAGTIVSGPSGSTANGSVDIYDPATGELTVQTVTLGSTTYHNVVAKVAGLISIGGVAGADFYDGTNLTIGTVQDGGSTYENLSVKVGSVVSVGGGLPSAAQDVYQNGQLTIAAVEYGGKVYTNVVVKVSSLGATTGS